MFITVSLLLLLFKCRCIMESIIFINKSKKFKIERIIARKKEMMQKKKKKKKRNPHSLIKFIASYVHEIYFLVLPYTYNAIVTL